MSDAAPRIEGWGIFDGKAVFDNELIGLRMIHGVEFEACCQILDELKDALDCNFEHEDGREGAIEFTLSNISWENGQITFPETGQWDFPPHWEYDIEITKIEYLEKEHIEPDEPDLPNF